MGLRGAAAPPELGRGVTGGLGGGGAPTTPTPRWGVGALCPVTTIANWHRPGSLNNGD